MKFKIRKCRWPQDERFEYRRIDWKESLPFVVNPRGLLTHRVKWAATQFTGDESHTAIGYWCGNQGNRLCDFVEVPPQERLVCARCEEMAVAAGEPTSEQIAGRHACMGELRVKRLCCESDDN